MSSKVDYWAIEVIEPSITLFYNVLEDIFDIPPYQAVLDALHNRFEPLQKWIKEHLANNTNEKYELRKSPPNLLITTSVYGEPQITMTHVYGGRIINVKIDYANIVFFGPYEKVVEDIMEKFKGVPGVKLGGFRW